MTLFSSIDFVHGIIIPAALALDLMIGDPRGLPHPIRCMGQAIEIWEPVIRRYLKNEYVAGALFAFSLILGSWAMVKLAVSGAYQFHRAAGIAIEVVLIFFCLSARSLSQAGMAVYYQLKARRVDKAREEVAMIVGRDVTGYGPDDIARATVETVAENFVDGVLSPLFFAAIGGAPLAMAYKMVNTLDSMVGYKNTRYHRFGRAAARIDDLANFIPARLSVALISMAAWILGSGHGRRALITAMKEGSHHKSPNAGYPEAAFAGVLGVKLNGPNYYGGVLVEKPFIGIGFGPVKAFHIQMSCELMLLAALISAIMAWCLALAW